MKYHYDTQFSGKLKLSRELTNEEAVYLARFSSSRRMKRDVKILTEKYKGEYGFNGSYGNEGEYFVGGTGDYGQDHDESVIDYNYPAGQSSKHPSKNMPKIANIECQPSLWCQWVIEDNKFLLWDGVEKFRHPIEWLNYMIKHFFSVWGITLNGTIDYHNAEDEKDAGLILVVNNFVKDYTLNLV